MNHAAQTLSSLFGGQSGPQVDAQTEEELAELQELLEAAEKARIKQDTRDGYERTLDKFLSWFEIQSRSTAVLGGPLIERGNLAEFLGCGSLRSQDAVMLYLAKRYKKDKVRHGSIRSDSSALTFCCKEAGGEISLVLRTRIAGFLVSCKKEDAEKRVRGEIQSQVGKRPLGFQEYTSLCEGMLAKGDVEGHLLVVLSWNCTNRVNESLNLAWDSIVKHEDHLVVTIEKSKSDQSGDRKKKVRVYANPFSAAICLFTSFGLYLLKYGADRTNGSSKIFAGHLTSLRSRFCKSIKKNVHKESAGGIEQKLIGSHSLRKGAASYISGSSTASVGDLALLRRGGWSTGMMARYISPEAESADCFIGRILAGLPRESKSFAMLPPHLESSRLPSAQQWCIEAFGDNPPVPMDVLAMCLTSVKHHQQALFNLSPTRYGTLLGRLGQVWENPLTGIGQSLTLRATGIPPDVYLQLSISEVQKQQAELKDLFASFSVAVENIPANVREVVEHHYELNGEVTPSHVQRVVNESLTNLQSVILNKVEALLGEERREEGVVHQHDDNRVARRVEWANGAASRLPLTYRLDCKWVLWELLWWWFRPSDFGGESIPPLKDLKAADFSHLERVEQRKQKVLLSDIQAIIPKVLIFLNTAEKRVARVGTEIEVQKLAKEMRIPPPPRKRTSNTSPNSKKYNSHHYRVVVRTLRNRLAATPLPRASARLADNTNEP